MISTEGMSVLPGLWDMHTHVFSNVSRPGTDLSDWAFIDEFNARISPDARWVAYATSENGRDEVYVVNVESGKRTRVSLDGGYQDEWNQPILPRQVRQARSNHQRIDVVRASSGYHGPSAVWVGQRWLYAATW